MKLDIPSSTSALPAAPVSALRVALRPTQRILIAFSGGLDSACLLHAAVSLREDFKLTVEAAHLDHALRPESGADAQFVKERCAAYGVPLHLERATPPDTLTNVEAWGRGVRYEFFTKTIAERKLDRILTAHTASDVAETLLMRLIANKAPRTIMPFDPRRHVVRPFLELTRDDLVEYAERFQIAHREDESNGDRRFLRNRVRAAVIPAIAAEFGPQIVGVIARRAVELDEDIEYLTMQAETAALRCRALPFGSREWLHGARGVLRELQWPIAWRCIEELFLPYVEYRVGPLRARSLAALLEGESAAVELPGGWSARRQDGGIALTRSASPQRAGEDEAE